MWCPKLARQLGEQFENFTQFAKGYWAGASPSVFGEAPPDFAK
jgi:hypothetical protein